MHKRGGTIIHLALIGLVAASLILAGCGRKATPQATPTPQEKATVAQAESATASGNGSTSETEKLLDNLLQLAPVHFTSSFTYTKGSNVTSKADLEGDLDARGSEHLYINDQNGQKMELYLVGGTLYLKSESDEGFVALSNMPQDSAFSFLSIYGGAYLLGFNQIKDAREVGSETVNGYDAVKYAIQQDNSSLSLSGLITTTKDIKWDYQGFIWVEPKTRAMVRAVVQWTTDAEGVKESYESEFNATKGTESMIDAPTNVIDLSDTPAGETPTANMSSGGATPTPAIKNIPTQASIGQTPAETLAPEPTQAPPPTGAHPFEPTPTPPPAGAYPFGPTPAPPPTGAYPY